MHKGGREGDAILDSYPILGVSASYDLSAVSENLATGTSSLRAILY